MIRREHGSDFLLMTQHDHSLLSGELARHVGNGVFAAPLPFGETVEGIANHDAGWPLHDDEPTLNAGGLPLHVFEVPAAVAIRVWSASVDRARALGPYEGLLVSLHVLGLSAWAVGRPTEGSASRQEMFEMNKFQHRQVEVQDELRRELGLSTEVPLNLGLAAGGTSAADDQLLFNFRLLAALDRVSLCLCCGKALFPVMEDVPARPGEGPTKVLVAMPDDSTVTLDPWPFDREEIRLGVAARRLRKRAFESVEAFREAYRAAGVETLELVVREG